MFDRLLIAVDGSDCARNAARHGLSVAARYDSDVEVVTVSDGDAERGRAILDEAADMAADTGVDAGTELLSGKPASAIADRVGTRNVDLAVVGRRGRQGVRRRLLGSVTERVLRRCPAPVLTVPNGDAPTDYGNVLVTTDGSDVADRAGPYGADLARRYDAPFHVLNAVDVLAEAGVFNAGGVDREYIERLERRGREAVDDLIAGVDDSELDVRPSVARGAPHDVVAGYVDDHDISLVVMSSEGQSNLVGQRLGTVAGRVLRTIDRPVLVVTGD